MLVYLHRATIVISRSDLTDNTCYHHLSTMEQAARGNFEINNDIKVSMKATRTLTSKLVDAAETAFLYSRDEEKALEDQEPWKAE